MAHGVWHWLIMNAVALLGLPDFLDLFDPRVVIPFCSKLGQLTWKMKREVGGQTVA